MEKQPPLSLLYRFKLYEVVKIPELDLSKLVMDDGKPDVAVSATIRSVSATEGSNVNMLGEDLLYDATIFSPIIAGPAKKGSIEPLPFKAYGVTIYESYNSGMISVQCSNTFGTLESERKFNDYTEVVDFIKYLLTESKTLMITHPDRTTQLVSSLPESNYYMGTEFAIRRKSTREITFGEVFEVFADYTTQKLEGKEPEGKEPDGIRSGDDAKFLTKEDENDDTAVDLAEKMWSQRVNMVSTYGWDDE